MKYRTLGTSDLTVSTLCLGSMTWGSQNTEAEGHAQIDRALDAGINFIDTAEMYPTTPRKDETFGDTEAIIGTWLAKPGNREKVIVASKVSGPGPAFLRDGRGSYADTVHDAIDGSLKRLQTDVIDLYQIHWPNRPHYHFRRIWDYDPSGQDRAAILENMEDVLGALGDLVRAGKIRHVGLSNETAWGTAQWLRLSEQGTGPRMVSIQNEYSLLCRYFDSDLAETAIMERVDLFAYSPLATGLLTGKYRGGAIPEGSRGSINANLGGRMTDKAGPAVEAYLGIAERHGLDPTQMALAWAEQRPFMGSVIFGATTMAQLDTALGAADLVLDDAVLAEIDTAHRAHPMPY